MSNRPDSSITTRLNFRYPAPPLDPLVCLSLPNVSGANAFEISNIQEDEN